MRFSSKVLYLHCLKKLKYMSYEDMAEGAGMDFSEFAAHLFPENIHPRAALQRVADKGLTLRLEQATKAAAMIGITIDELITMEKPPFRPGNAPPCSMSYTTPDGTRWTGMTNFRTKITYLYTKKSLEVKQVRGGLDLGVTEYTDIVMDVLVGVLPSPYEVPQGAPSTPTDDELLEGGR